MPSRPQFSLRVLFFMTAMVCLASATVAELPEEQTFATASRDVLRVVLCIVFPAMLLAGAVAKRGYARAMYIGGLFAASIPLLRAFATLYGMIDFETLETLAEQLVLFSSALWPLRRAFAVMWALAPCASYACFLVHRLWRQGDDARETTTLSAAQIQSRAALTAIAAGFAATAAVEIQSHGLFAAVQKPLMIALTVVFPALLVIGAVEGTGRFQIFCIGAAVPATFALARLCIWLGRTVYYFDSATDWSTAVDCLTQQRRSTAALWACAPPFGMACVFFHWLFPRGKSEAKAE